MSFPPGAGGLSTLRLECGYRAPVRDRARRALGAHVQRRLVVRADRLARDRRDGGRHDPRHPRPARDQPEREADGLPGRHDRPAPRHPVGLDRRPPGPGRAAGHDSGGDRRPRRRRRRPPAPSARRIGPTRPRRSPGAVPGGVAAELPSIFQSTDLTPFVLLASLASAVGARRVARPDARARQDPDGGLPRRLARDVAPRGRPRAVRRDLPHARDRRPRARDRRRPGRPAAGRRRPGDTGRRGGLDPRHRRLDAPQRGPSPAGEPRDAGVRRRPRPCAGSCARAPGRRHRARPRRARRTTTPSHASRRPRPRPTRRRHAHRRRRRRRPQPRRPRPQPPAAGRPHAVLARPVRRSAWRAA